MLTFLRKQDVHLTKLDRYLYSTITCLLIFLPERIYVYRWCHLNQHSPFR